ncbi:hypothetical protein NHH03_12995 [Stieleria sp. TO1_6]|uniref:hypothetical protein n=1 Tax=Stieleria tagensis TaxID=2956795 RepID=UPI00209A78B1|nr:hypothetical protein [Stieleria tagensis]MCO8122657.1 hypothetical protein [Stieleria tagensis]
MADSANDLADHSGDLGDCDRATRPGDREQSDHVPVDQPLVEIGIIVAGSLDPVDEPAVKQATRQFIEFVQQTFPDFRWHLVESRRPEAITGQITGQRIAPSSLLQQALEERDEQHWDFAFVLTPSELESHYSTHCFAALSRPLNAAAFSLSLIDPRAIGRTGHADQRIATIANRLSRLMLHALGHLLGLSRADLADNLLYHPASAKQLDSMQQLDESQIAKLQTALYEIADQRLEEAPGRRLAALPFIAQSAWINRREIAQAIVAARPWQFPQRLSGLTLASVSTLAVLLMTAESWDLALSQPGMNLVALAVLSWIITTAYVIVRQQLIVRDQPLRSEQIVVTTFAAIGIVFTGMLVAWMFLMFLASSIAWLMFRADLIAAWASSSSFSTGQIGLSERLQMATFASSLGLMIGSLGTSFEAQHYFRHVIFVDEEI